MNILAIAPKPPYVQVAEGTFTRANSRLSLVDGTAFFDCGADLSAYAGLDTGSHEYLIKVYDDDGYSIQGYVGAGGGGEAQSDFYRDDGDVDLNAGWGKMDCTMVFDTDHYVITRTAYSQSIWTNSGNTTTKGKLYFNTITTKNLLNAQGDAGSFGQDNTSSLVHNKYDFNVPADWIKYTRYFTCSANDWNRFVVNLSMATNTDEAGLKEVLVAEISDCAATGFHIISAQGGSTQNWTSESASFNYNDSDGYSYKIWKVR